MELSDKTKILILIAIFVIVIFFFIQHRTKKQNIIENDSDDVAIHNEGSLNNRLTTKNTDEIKQELDDVEENEEEQHISRQEIPSKFRTRNSPKDGKFINSSYLEGSEKRTAKSGDIDKFFEEGFPLDEKLGYQKNEQLKEIQYANYVPGKKTKLRDVDKFNADSLLPKEKNKDWFDDPYEATTVKNTHLINIYRPIGVNTIQTTLKNANRQLRADPIVPKISGISPFLNSSVEPDTNIRNQALCV